MESYIINQDGFIVGTHICQKNPMSHIEGEPEFLTPENVVTVELPSKKLKEGKAYKFDGEKWVSGDDPVYLAKKAEEQAIIEQKEKFAKEQKEHEDAKNAIIEAQKLADQKREAERVARQSRLETASAKLKALGLTDDEIKAMIGG